VKKMGIFRRNVPRNYLPIHPDNIAANDWIILLEAGTIVGPSAVKLRVALATLEKKVVTKYNIFLRKKHYLVLPGYDPRIHALYFCPQLYKPDTNKKLAPLDGEEIGQLIASSVWDGVVRKRDPGTNLPNNYPIDRSLAQHRRILTPWLLRSPTRNRSIGAASGCSRMTLPAPDRIADPA
jgi:hypothetical protein